MTTIVVTVHIVVSLFLIVIVLLQHGKGADMGAAFGGASQTLFGTEGPLPLLNKITTASAIIFMITSIALAHIASSLSKDSVMSGYTPPAATQTAEQAPPQTVPMPAAPADGSQPAASAPAPFPADQAAAPIEPLQASEEKPADNTPPASTPIDKKP